MKFFYILLLLTITNVAISSEVDQYINEGIKLHDKGNYENAVQKYKKALELEPNSSLALYELTMTYMVSNKNKECIEAAKKRFENKI